MDNNELENLAVLLKGNEESIYGGLKKVCLTALVVDKLNNLINIHIKQSMIENPTSIDFNNRRTNEKLHNIEIIYKLIQNTSYLKLINDINEVENPINISEFKHLKLLEINKIDINLINGIQLLRLHLQRVICIRCIESIKSLLEDCGADYSSKYIWNELKELTLPYNKLTCLDNSLDCAPWLHTLDLSHNDLTKADEISCLTNLKYLNLSYNKLQMLPKFSGQVCNRLQILNVSNNFLEEITEVQSLVNIYQLDLSNNCLLDHRVLVSISHMATLQWLNLRGNPVSHLLNRHRDSTCEYLHCNIESQRFILDGQKLSKNEIKRIGLFHPLLVKTADDYYGNDCKVLCSSERIRKVRNVEIEDNKNVNDKAVNPMPSSVSPTVDPLEIKQHIQSLRAEFGESWLQHYNRPDVAEGSSDLLTSVEVSSSKLPSDTEIGKPLETTTQEAEQETTVYTFANSESEEEASEDEEMDLGGEENIFLVTLQDESDPVFVVITSRVIIERECITSKERNQWVLDTLTSCKYIDEEQTVIQIDFDTLRKDKKQRIYTLCKNDAEHFFTLINQLIADRSLHVLSKIYQCMKCLKKFSKHTNYNNSENVECPSCHSTIIIEDMANN